MEYGTALQVLIVFCLAGLGMHLYTLYCLKRLSRKLNWWRNNAIKANSQLKNVNYKLNEIKKGGKMASSVNSPSD